MPEMTSYAHGTPSWIDVSTNDLDGSVAFYEGLLGWQVGERGGEDVGGYTMFQLRGLDAAAVSPAMPGDPTPPHWTTYITVDDVDATTAEVERLGGTVVAPPFDVMEFGRMSVITDPSGAFVALWQAGSHIGARVVNEPGALCWNELTTRDADAACAFFGGLLGWTSRRDESSGYIELHRAGDDAVIGGVMPMVGEMWPADLPSHWTVYVAVADCDATVARCEELGGTVSVPPTDIPVGRFAVLGDPQGAFFSVIALREG